MDILGVDLQDCDPCYIRVEGTLAKVSSLPRTFPVTFSEVEVIVYGHTSYNVIIGTGYLVSGANESKVYDSMGKVRGVIRYETELLGITEPALIPSSDARLSCVPTLGRQMYPSFVLDNQRPGSWNHLYFSRKLDSLRQHLTHHDAWSQMRALILLVTHRTSSTPFVEDTEAGVMEQSSNELWSSDVPNLGGDCEDKARAVLCTWYALRRVHRTVEKGTELWNLSKLANRIYMFAAHCSQFETGGRHLCVAVSTRKYALTGGKTRHHLLPDCEWDGSFFLLECTLPTLTWYGKAPKSAPLSGLTNISLVDLLNSKDVKEVEFMHCMRRPRHRYVISPAASRQPHRIRDLETRLSHTTYLDGLWQGLRALPAIIQPIT